MQYHVTNRNNGDLVRICLHYPEREVVIHIDRTRAVDYRRTVKDAIVAFDPTIDPTMLEAC